MSKPNLLVIVGATATGKSELAITLAEQFDGEIISADSRQVYRGLDLGSGKVAPAERRGIPHHLLDVADLAEDYTVARFKTDAVATITEITNRRKLPILVGGSGLYIQAVVDNLRIPPVAPQPQLRRTLDQLTTAQLITRLSECDPATARTIDHANRRRLIRAIEVSEISGQPFSAWQARGQTSYRSLLLGLRQPKAELRRRIADRLAERMAAGLLLEVAALHRQGVPWSRLESLGLEYRWLAEHLQGQRNLDETTDGLRRDIVAYAKRQETWWRRDPRITWLTDPRQAEPITAAWLAATATLPV